VAYAANHREQQAMAHSISAYMTVPDLIRYARVGKTTIYAALKAGHLQRFKPHGRRKTLVLRKQVIAWLEGRSEPAARPDDIAPASVPPQKPAAAAPRKVASTSPAVGSAQAAQPPPTAPAAQPWSCPRGCGCRISWRTDANPDLSCRLCRPPGRRAMHPGYRETDHGPEQPR
jgi:hypothetical protein